MQNSSNKNVSLDVLRFGAALLVLVEHVRASVFVPFESLEANRILLAPFYAMTSMGHEAVMIFFAMSGYLVGGHVIRRLQEGQWSFADYAIRRLTRLWIVVLPALLATYLVDHLSMSLGNEELYSGGYLAAAVPSLQAAANPASYSWLTFLGNAFFLQTILVPVYGSNGPLWSLAYEFWYYVMFPPLAWAIIGSGRLRHRVGAVAIVIVFVLLLPWDITRLGLVFLAGSLSYIVAKNLPDLSFANKRWMGCLGFATIILVSLASVYTRALDDLILGLIVASCLPLISMQSWKSNIFTRVCDFGAEMSYTLYVFHFSIVICVAGFMTLPERLAPSLQSFSIFLFICLLSLTLSAVLWTIFERHTRILTAFFSNYLDAGKQRRRALR